MRLKTHKRASRWPQDNPKSPQEAPKRSQDGPKRLQESPKRRQEDPREGPRGPPRRAQVASKSLPSRIQHLSYVKSAPKRRPGGPKNPQEAPRSAPKRRQGGPKNPQEAPRSSQGHPKMPPRGPQEAFKEPPRGRLGLQHAKLKQTSPAECA